MLYGEGGGGGKDRYPTDSGIYLVESLLGEIKGGFAKREMVDAPLITDTFLTQSCNGRASRFSAFLRFENTPGKEKRERERAFRVFFKVPNKFRPSHLNELASVRRSFILPWRA